MAQIKLFREWNTLVAMTVFHLVGCYCIARSYIEKDCNDKVGNWKVKLCRNY